VIEKKEGKKTVLEKPKDLTDAKRTKTLQDEMIVIEEEIKMGFESGVGSLIGEIAMMDPSKASRALSGMAKTDSVFLLLNHDAFEVLVKVYLNFFLII
jgi:CRP-like cAMP-binding protein